jgi:hypothetical protein
VSEGRKTLLESEPSLISPARETPGNRSISNAPTAATGPVLGKGDIEAKAFYGPLYGIIQNIQGFQGFSFCSKNIYFSKNLFCLFADFANSYCISPQISMS